MPAEKTGPSISKHDQEPETGPGTQRTERLSDDALVVRGGLMLLSDLERAAEVCQASLGFPGISVYAADGLGLAELVMATPLAHSQLRWSRAGRLRAAGFALEPTRSWPHYTLRLTDASPAELRRVEQTFSPPEPNPRHRP